MWHYTHPTEINKEQQTILNHAWDTTAGQPIYAFPDSS